MRNRIYLLILILAGSMPALFSQSVEEKEALIKSFYEKLESETTARDSLRTLYDIFDLSGKSGQIKAAWQIYETAGNAEDVNMQMDMIRNLSVLHMSNDSIIDVLLNMCEKIPNQDARDATRLFVRNQQISRKMQNSNSTNVQENILKKLNAHQKLESDNVYDQIEFLFDASQFLSGDTEGSLFREIFDKYGELIEGLPAADHPLKSQYYTTSAIIHTRNGDYEEAVEADREVMKIIDQLQQFYKKKKRNYRNYDRNKFVCYRRMLSNYPALSDQEIRDIRDSINALYYTSQDVRHDMDTHSNTLATYYMAIKEYEKAIPLIKESLKKDNLADYQRTAMFRMLREAAKKTGDKRSLLMALEYYDEYLESKDSLRALAEAREDMIRERIDSTENIFGPKMKKIAVGDTVATDSGKTALMIVSGILAVLLIVYMVLYTRIKTGRNKKD